MSNDQLIAEIKETVLEVLNCSNNMSIDWSVSIASILISAIGDMNAILLINELDLIIATKFNISPENINIEENQTIEQIAKDLEDLAW